MKRLVLVVGENKEFVEWIRSQLVGVPDLVTVGADSKNAGLEIALQLRPHLILVEINQGLEDDDTLCRRLRRNWETREIPLLLIFDSNVTNEGDLLQKLGAAGYLHKPVVTEELLAKVGALTLGPRSNDFENGVFEDGHLLIDSRAFLVQVDGRAVRLTLKEFRLLSFLVRNRGQVFSRDRLLDAVWERHPYNESRTVDVHIRRIRMKLGHGFEHYIQTIVGVGYLFHPSNAPVATPRG